MHNGLAVHFKGAFSLQDTAKPGIRKLYAHPFFVSFVDWCKMLLQLCLFTHSVVLCATVQNTDLYRKLFVSMFSSSPSSSHGFGTKKNICYFFQCFPTSAKPAYDTRIDIQVSMFRILGWPQFFMKTKQTGKKQASENFASCSFGKISPTLVLQLKER